MAKKKSDSHGLRATEAQLQKRAERASQITSPREQANELFAVWEQASQNRTLAGELWFAGRKAAMLLIEEGDRTHGIDFLVHTLSSLREHRLYQEYASCVKRVAGSLTDEELLTALRASRPHRALLGDLTNDTRQSLLRAARASLVNTGSADDTILVGMLLDIEGTAQRSATEQPSLETRALRYSRYHGAINVAGISFQGLYALRRVLQDETITELGLEDLEDVRLRRSTINNPSEIEHVQAKTRNDGWTIPALQSQSADGNRVFDSFAQAAVADPTAQFRFATDSGLTRGQAPALLSAVARLSQVGVNAALSDAEEEALAQLEAGMRQELLSDIDIRSLLARVTIDTGQSSDLLRSETMLAISDALNVRASDARVAFYALMGIFQEAMAERKTFSRAEIREFLEKAARASGSFTGRIGVSGRVEVVDFEAESTSTRERFYEGLSSNPADIRNAWDIPRPDLMALIDDGFAERRGCLIRGASGQGKTVLMYRYAYDSRVDELIVRVLGGLDHGAAGDVIEAVNELPATTVLVLVDNVARGDRFAWSEAMTRLLQHPRIKVLVTSREDDWNLAEIHTLNPLVAEVNVRLDESAAEGIFLGLTEAYGDQLHADDWREPFEQADGLLMEFIYLLTQGRRMVDVLREQIGGLRLRLGDGRQPVLDVLCYIATAHAYGGYLTRKTLAALLGFSSEQGLGDHLRVLEQEFWIRDAAGGEYVGLHEVRSALVRNIMHEHESLNDSIDAILQKADAGEVGAMVESLLLQSDHPDPDWIPALLHRAENEGPAFAHYLVQAAYAAEERRYADRFAAGLQAAHAGIGQAMLHVMNYMPSPHAGSDMESLLSDEGKALAAAQNAQLPQRDFRVRMDHRLLSALGSSALGNWLLGEDTVSHGIPLLRIASLVAPDVARAAVTSAGVYALRDRILDSSPDTALDLMDAVREANVEAALELQAELGNQYLVDQAGAAPGGCIAIRLDGPLIYGRFLAEADEDARERAVRLTTRLYRLFPTATESDVVGLIDVGVEAIFAHSQIPRVNLTPNSWRITANQFWLSLCAERLSGSSVAAVVRQQFQFVRALLEAMRETHNALSASATSKLREALALWAHSDERARNIPFVPRTTPPLVKVVQQGGKVEYALPGSQPIDNTFSAMKQAASSAHRELSGYVETRRFNRAILIHQLGDLERACSDYQKLVARITDEADVHLLEDLEHMAHRLRKNLQMLTDDALSRDDRQLANESYERFSALRALTADVIGRVRAGQERAQVGPNEARDSTAIVQALGEWALALSQWPDYRTLVSLASGIHDALAAGDDIAVRDSMDNWGVDVRRLAPSTALDLEAWLYEARRREWISALARSVERQLAEQGMETQCLLLDEGLDEFLLVTMVIVARIPDVTELRAVMAAVEDSAFATLPGQVSELVLLTVDAGGNILPVGFRRFRNSTPLPQELPLNSFAPWHPSEDVATYADQVGRGIAQVEHPAAQLVTQLDHGIQRLGLTFGHFYVLAVTAHEEGWEVGVESSSRVVARLSLQLTIVQQQVDAVRESIQQGDTWEPIACQIVGSASHYLKVLLLVTDGQPDANEVAAAIAELGAARNALTNMVYLGVAPPATWGATLLEACSEFEQARGRLGAVFDQMRSDS